MYRSCHCFYQFFNFDYLVRQLYQGVLLVGFTVYYCFASCFFLPLPPQSSKTYYEPLSPKVLSILTIFDYESFAE